MKDQVWQTIKKYHMFNQDEVIILAISGGVDSMVLLHLMIEFQQQWNLTLIVTHLDHGKRTESFLDRQLIEKVAKDHGLAFEWDFMPKEESSGNFQNHARNMRYEYFSRMAHHYQAHKVVTAHHADDHLETVVGRLLKNNTPASLIGIQAKGEINGLHVVRPLIEVKKEDIHRFAKIQEIAYNEDITNETDLYLRNRIRHYITPQLLKEDQGVLKQVRQLSDHLEADEDYFSSQVELIMSRATSVEQSHRFSKTDLQPLHPSVLRRWLKHLMPTIDQNTVLSVIDMLNDSKPHMEIDVGKGQVIKVSYDNVYWVSKENQTPEPYHFELKVGTEVKLPCGGKLSVSKRSSEKKFKNDPNVLDLCYNSEHLPLSVRNRQFGDRIELLNQQGSSKVKKIMIDKKIPRDQREAWPIVVSKDNEILWIPGLKKAPMCLDENEKNTCLTIEYTRRKS